MSSLSVLNSKKSCPLVYLLGTKYSIIHTSWYGAAEKTKELPIFEMMNKRLKQVKSD